MDNEERIKAVGRRLTAMRERILSRLGVAATHSTHALSSYDNHPADLATDTTFREMDAGLKLGLENRLGEVERALEKVSSGTYGVCDRCGAAIDPDRLNAKPEAVLCLKCEQDVNTGYVPPPSEASVTPLPFGRPREFLGKEAPIFDGEDIWQELASWGTSDSPQDVPPAITYEQTFVDFREPVGYVEPVETFIDEHGDVLWDTVRKRPLKEAEQNTQQSDEY